MADRTPLAERIAAAPISWGVCEVPGWGWQHQPPTVLTQMRDLGIAATEFGPDGFLPDDPQAKAATLAEYGLAAVGQGRPGLTGRFRVVGDGWGFVQAVGQQHHAADLGRARPLQFIESAGDGGTDVGVVFLGGDGWYVYPAPNH